MKLFERIILFFGGYGSDGYNKRGYDRAGYDKNGLDVKGFTKNGYNRWTNSWFDRSGYNVHGFDANGEHKDYAHLKGNRISTIDKGIVEVDIHGMSVKAAVKLLDSILDSTWKKGIHTVVVIHGYRHGSVLKATVENYEHPMITEIIDEIENRGMTIFKIGGFYGN